MVLGGREADRGATRAVAASLGAEGSAGGAAALLDLTGRTDLAEAAAVIGRSSVLLANDSGAAHLAVAVGTPAVAIFGPTDPKTLWTWDRPERYVALAGPSTCARPCFRADCPGDHGYGAIAPADVAALLARLIDQRVEGAPGGSETE